MKEVRFGCNQCGKCCNSAPELEGLEAMQFIKEFDHMFMLSVEESHSNLGKMGVPGSILDSPLDAKKAKKIFAKHRGIVFGGDVLKHKLCGKWRVRLSAHHITMGENGKKAVTPKQCPMLGENGCTINGDKPQVCHLVPATVNMMGEIEYYNLKNFINEYSCDTGKGQELIFKGTDITGSFKTSRAKILAMRKKTYEISNTLFLDMVFHLIDGGKIHSAKDISTVIHKVFKNKVPVKYENVLSAFFYHELISMHDYKNYIDVMKSRDLSRFELIKEVEPEIINGGLYRDMLSNWKEFESRA